MIPTLDRCHKCDGQPIQTDQMPATYHYNARVVADEVLHGPNEDKEALCVDTVCRAFLIG